MNAVRMAEKRPACAQSNGWSELHLDTGTHEDKKTVDLLVVFLQEDLVLLLKPDLCTSPLRSQLKECPILTRMVSTYLQQGLHRCPGPALW
jgi:hypothetical protein